MRCIYVLQWDKEQYVGESIAELLSKLNEFLVSDSVAQTPCDYTIKVRELPDDIV